MSGEHVNGARVPVVQDLTEALLGEYPRSHFGVHAVPCATVPEHSLKRAWSPRLGTTQALGVHSKVPDIWVNTLRPHCSCALSVRRS